MSHELVGLTEKELEENYYSHNPELKKALNVITEGVTQDKNNDLRN
jgi:hypothetical protein